MNSTIRFANTITPTPSQAWCTLHDDQRLVLVKNTLAASMLSFSEALEIIDAKEDGQVIAHLMEPLPADKRGTLLLDLEELLKESIDPGLVVWLEPLGDRSSLRNLRGIEVKS